jgi:hypothetical protein
VADTDLITALASLDEWPELSYRLRLTDGLPTFPPTRARVDALVESSGREAADIIGAIPPADRAATVEAVAANAVMAGAVAEHFPVVLAGVEAMLDEAFNLRGMQCTTHGCAPLLVVSGPCVDRLDIATAESVFNGGGSRASLAIGRAVRLTLWNIGGAYPGEPVKEVFGHAGRLGLAIGERAEESPWPTLAAARGVPSDGDAVTAFACEAPQSVAFWGANDSPRERLSRVADVMSALGNNNTHTMGECLVVFSPSEARHLAANGLTRADVQQTLFELARRRLGVLRPRGPLRPDDDPRWFYEWWPDWVDQTSDDELVPVVREPDAIHVLVTGADSIPWAAVCPGWGHLGGFAVTREVQW